LVRAKQRQPKIIYELHLGAIHGDSLRWFPDECTEKELMHNLKEKIFVVAGDRQHS